MRSAAPEGPPANVAAMATTPQNRFENLMAASPPYLLPEG
jgi:hypothetical protein